MADERGREKERYPVVPGARIKIKDDGKVALGKLLVEWDPFTTPILTEVSGTVTFRDIVDGVTIREEFDEVTGLARRVIIEDQEGKLQPRVSVKAPSGGDNSPDSESAGETRGRVSASFDSMITLRDRPVTSSSCSCMVTPSMTSPYFTVPPTSVRIGTEKGSHSESIVLGPTLSPFFTCTLAP